LTITPTIPPATLSSLPLGNLLSWSQDFTRSAWTASNVALTAGQASWDGSNTATLMTGTGGGFPQVSQNAGLNSGNGAFSVYVKAGTATASLITVQQTSPVNVTVCRLSIAWSGGAPTGTLTSGTGFSISSVGAGWYRVSVSGAGFSGSGTYNCRISPDANSSNASMYAAGAQAENQPAPTTYSATMAAANVSIWAGAQSLPVFPFLPGQAIAVSKAPKWSTEVIRSASGRERRTAYWASPLWQFELAHEVIRHRPTNDELATLWEFFNVAQGQFGTWLLVDPTDCQILGGAPSVFGIGDGSTTTFQLSRALNSFSEPVYDVYGAVILDNGVPSTTNFTFSPNGQVTFSAAPAAGHTLSWFGYFYFGCRFAQDDLTFAQIVNLLWSGKALKFTSLRP
jgi:uncharacterized protein (TIGR02217 family)